MNNRILEDSNNSKYYINYTGNINIDEYIVEPESDSVDIDLREANENKNNNELNYTNLTQYSIKTIQNDEVQMKGSISDSKIYSIVDKDGILESIEEKVILLMKTDNMENDQDNNQNYNNENNNFTNGEEYNNNNNIFSNLSNLYIVNSAIINRTGYFKNENINKKVYDYFDNYSFYLYKKPNNDSEYVDEDENNTARVLEEEVTYYGLKKFNIPTLGICCGQNVMVRRNQTNE